MFRGGKYAQKDASKVNMFEIAQLSRALVAPAKSCVGDGERTSKRREVESEKETETERVENPPTPSQ